MKRFGGWTHGPSISGGISAKRFVPTRTMCVADRERTSAETFRAYTGPSSCRPSIVIEEEEGGRGKYYVNWWDIHTRLDILHSRTVYNRSSQYKDRSSSLSCLSKRSSVRTFYRDQEPLTGILAA
jgi:hypothetical protein